MCIEPQFSAHVGCLVITSRLAVNAKSKQQPHVYMQVAVALVQSMKLQGGRTEAEQAEYFAKSLHKAWGVGDASCDNGLVFFLSKDDRQVLLVLLD